MQHKHRTYKKPKRFRYPIRGFPLRARKVYRPVGTRSSENVDPAVQNVQKSFEAIKLIESMGRPIDYEDIFSVPIPHFTKMMNSFNYQGTNVYTASKKCFSPIELCRAFGRVLTGIKNPNEINNVLNQCPFFHFITSNEKNNQHLIIPCFEGEMIQDPGESVAKYTGIWKKIQLDDNFDSCYMLTTMKMLNPDLFLNYASDGKLKLNDITCKLVGKLIAHPYHFVQYKMLKVWKIELSTEEPLISEDDWGWDITTPSMTLCNCLFEYVRKGEWAASVLAEYEKREFHNAMSSGQYQKRRHLEKWKRLWNKYKARKKQFWTLIPDDESLKEYEILPIKSELHIACFEKVKTGILTDVTFL